MGQPKQRKQRQKPRKKPQGVLADHEARGRVRVPPLMSLGAPMVARSWHREMLPDFLWLAAMLGRRSAWRAAYEPLDVVDEFVPDGPRILDGRLSSVALVPEDQRAAAREALRSRAPSGLPSDLGHMFARENDTLICREPLHGGHRLGAFMPSSRTVGPVAPMTAFQYARDGIAAIFRHLGIGVEDNFQPLEQALRQALYTDADGDDGEAESA